MAFIKCRNLCTLKCQQITKKIISQEDYIACNINISSEYIYIYIQRSKEVHLKCYIHSYYLNFGHVEKQKVFVQSKTLIKSYKAIFS